MGLKTGRELGMFRRHWEAYPIDLIDEHKLPTGDTSFIPPSCRPEIKPVLGLGKFHRTVSIEMSDNVTPSGFSLVDIPLPFTHEFMRH
jgi:hypothetical protein